MASIIFMKIKPRVGWVRADQVPGEELKDELLRLRREIDSLNEELSVARHRAVPEGLEELAQGDDTTYITIFDEDACRELGSSVRWDRLMRALLPQTLGGGAPPEAIVSTIVSLVHQGAVAEFDARSDDAGWRHAILAWPEYGKVLNQMVALGLIEGRTDSINPAATRWCATPYGIQTGSRLLAVKHG